jgi:hypothetical protein
MIRRTLFVFNFILENMDKLEFVAKVKQTHQEYETALASLTEAQMLQPRTCGDWTVKDVIAHVTWYEREMVGVLKQRALLGSCGTCPSKSAMLRFMLKIKITPCLMSWPKQSKSINPY